MSLPVVRVGDLSTGHGCFAEPQVAIEGSPNVLVNGLGANRFGDSWSGHFCPTLLQFHDGVSSGGSPTVLVNGRFLVRIGDPISCGDTAATGSPNVLAG